MSKKKNKNQAQSTLHPNLEKMNFEIIECRPLNFSFDMRRIPPSGTKMSFELGITHSLAITLESLQIKVRMSFFDASEKVKSPLYTFETGTTFAIENAEASKTEDGKDAILPSFILNMLAQTAYDTSRGLLLSRISGTHLSSSVIPPLAAVAPFGVSFTKSVVDCMTWIQIPLALKLHDLENPEIEDENLKKDN